MNPTVTIFHNPNCGTSRNVLAMIRESGIEPEIVEYLKVGWTKAELERLLSGMGLTPHDLLREKGTLAAELALLAPSTSDKTILDAMLEHPILVERPIVATPKGVKLCRPSERVLELLENPPANFTKEDGEVVKA